MLDPKVAAVLRAAEAGRVDLPDDLLKQWRGLKKLKQMRIAAPQPEDAATALVESVLDGNDPPGDWADQAYAATLAVERHRAAGAALDGAVLLAEAGLESALPAAVPGAVESLQKRLEDLLEAAGRLLTSDGALADLEFVNAETVLTAGDDARAALLELRKLGASLAQLRDAWLPLIWVVGVESDLVRLYGTVADVPSRWPSLSARDVEPWPADATELIIWAVKEGAPLWLPTAQQIRDAHAAAREARARREAERTREARSHPQAGPAADLAIPERRPAGIVEAIRPVEGDR